MPSPTYALTELRYREAKRRILAKFVSESDKCKYSFEFHPCFTLRAPSSNAAKRLCALLEEFSTAIIQEGLSIKVFCDTFRELKRAYAFLCNATAVKPILLEAERQFLLQKGWSYFDGFKITDGLEKLNFPAFNDYIEYSRAAILSNLLSLPPEDAAMLTNNDASTVFLENILYESCKPLNKTIAYNTHRLFLSNLNAESLALSIVRNNIGFETLNCDCCKPHSSEAPNVLGNSLVVARFKHNAFFFNSSIPCYASLFHRTHSGRRSRVMRMREYSLRSFPIGPLFKGQEEAVPLIDALRLKSKGWAEILGVHSLQWVCMQKSSALSKHILVLLKKLKYAERVLRKRERRLIAEKRLGAFLEEGLKSAYLNSYINTARNLLLAVLYKLLNENSVFFQYELASAIYAGANNNVAYKNRCSAQTIVQAAKI